MADESMPPAAGPTGLHPVVAAVLGWVPFVLVDLVQVVQSEIGQPPFFRQLQHPLFEFGNTCAAAGISGLGVYGYGRFKRKLLPNSAGFRARIVDVVLLAQVALLVCFGVVALDYDSLAFRKGVEWHIATKVLRSILTALTALGLAAALPIGLLLARPWLRWAAVAGAFAMSIINFRIFLNDYWNLHLVLIWASAILAGASLVGAIPPPKLVFSRRTMLAALVVFGAVASWSVSLPAAPGLAARLLWTHASPFTPLSILWGYRGRTPPAVIPEEQKLWFTPRKPLPPIPSTADPDDASQAIVLMLTIDSFRADEMNRLGDRTFTLDASSRPKEPGKFDEYMPTIAKMRDEGVYFPNAYSPGAQTVYTMSSWFTGKYYSQLYWTWRAFVLPWLSDDKTERFPLHLAKEKGVRSVYVMAGNWLTPDNGLVGGFSKYINLQRGKKYDEYATAEPVTDEIVNELEQYEGGPLYVFAHYMDAHHPYEAGKGKKGLTPMQRSLKGVTRVDTQIARLQDKLAELGLTSHTTIIVSADHGEAFGDHGTTQHGCSVYNELIRVPLVIQGPGYPAHTVDALVTTIDLGPTILDTFGADTPAIMMGESLVPVLRGEAPHFTRPIVSENRLRQTMVFPDGIKVSRDLYFGAGEAYDLTTDPLELDNRVDDPSLDTVNRFATLTAFYDAHTLRFKGYKPPYRK